MPAMRTGDSGAVRVGFLVAGNALQRWNTVADRASDHVGEMTVPVIALLRVIGSGMAIDTARVREN